MSKYNYTATIDITDKKIKEFIKDLFGDKEEYDEKQKRFREAAIKDALDFFLNSYKLDGVYEDALKILENIAVSMYFRGFNRAFEYYVKHEDIFNLESNENTKQD